jgi:hypothetical protein
MTEIEIQLANAARNWLDAYSDVEAYLPPDDSASWGDNAGDLIQERDESEQSFLNLVEKIKRDAVIEAIEQVTNLNESGMQTGTTPYWADYRVQRFIKELKQAVHNGQEGV